MSNLRRLAQFYLFFREIMTTENPNWYLFLYLTTVGRLWKYLLTQKFEEKQRSTKKKYIYILFPKCETLFKSFNWMDLCKQSM